MQIKNIQIDELNKKDNMTTPPKRYLTVKEITGYLPLSTATIYELVRKRHIPFVPFGKKIIFDTQAIDKWMQRRMVKSVDSIKDMI